jgi:multiple sugar transport system substrate-binding protein
LQEAVTAFNSSQEQIKAELRLIPEKDYSNTLQVTKPADLPDVLMIDGPTIASMVYNKKIRPLTELISAETKANALPAMLAQGVVDGKLYGLGQFEAGLGVWGNKKLLDAAGVKYPTTLAEAWTADQFTAAIKALAAKDGDGKVLDIKENYDVFNGEWGTFGFAPIIYSAGGALLRNGKAAGALDSPESVQALKTMASWRPYVDPNSKDDAFATGKVALSWVGHWTFPDYDKALGSDLVLMPLPNFGKGTKSGHGSWTWGISAQSKNPVGAGKFMDHLLSDAPVAAMTAANGAVPGTKTALARSELYKPGGKLAMFSAQLDKPCDAAVVESCVVVTRAQTAGYPVVSKQFAAAMVATYQGGDAKAELSKAAMAIDQDFTDNQGYELG